MSRTLCPACADKGKDNSRNNLVNYSDGGSYCYACGYFVSDGNKSVGEQELEDNQMPQYTLDNILSKRGISSDVIKRYGLTLVENDGNLMVRVPVTDANGQESGAQYRLVDTSSGKLTRDMRTTKGSKLKVPCFGVNTITKLTKTILVCEGWTDALAAASTVEGRSDISVLGLCGATFAKRAAMFLARYHEDKRIVLALDNDEAGAKAKDDFVSTTAQHSPDKLLYKLAIPNEHKDIGDWLNSTKVDLVQELENAAPVFSSNLLTSEDVGNLLVPFLNKLKNEEHIRLNFSPSLDAAVKLMPGKLVGILGDSGQGKSTLAEHLMLEAITQKERVFCVSAEMSAEEVALKLMRTVKREPLHLSSYLKSLDEEYFSEIAEQTKRVLSWLTLVDNFGEVSLEKIDSYLLELAAANRKPSLVVVDHLLAISESLEPNSLQKTCEELKGLARKHSVCVVLLCHTKKPQNQTRRTIYRPMLSDAYGSNGLSMYADVVLAVAKDAVKNETYVEAVKQERMIGKYVDVTLAFEDWQLSETQNEAAPSVYDNESEEAAEEETEEVY